MKLTGYLTAAIMVMAMASCQKSYNPPDLVIGNNNGTGSGSGSSVSGPLLVKYEQKTTGSPETSSQTFEYDASNRIIRTVINATDSTGASVSYYFRYARDASGKITKIVTNILSGGMTGTGLPDSIAYVLHYPASGGFDNASYSVSLSGIVLKDSMVYVYNAGGLISDVYDYQSVNGAPSTLVSRLQYVYTGSNITLLKGYDASVSTTNPSGNYTFEYDSKPGLLNVGNEAFLPGLDASFACTNNVTKQVITVPNLNETILYTYQYSNTTQRPVSAVVNHVTAKKTSAVTFTYQ